MARGKQTFRMSTGGAPSKIPRPEPAIALNRDGSVKRDPVKDREERIRKMKAEFCRAKQLMKEAQELMAKVEISFLDLEKTDFSDLQDLGKNN